MHVPGIFFFRLFSPRCSLLVQRKTPAMSLPNTPPALSVAHDILSDMYLPPLVVDYDQTGVMLDHQQQYVVMEPPQGYEHVDQTDLPLTPTTPQTPTSAQLGTCTQQK